VVTLSDEGIESSYYEENGSGEGIETCGGIETYGESVMLCGGIVIYEESVMLCEGIVMSCVENAKPCEAIVKPCEGIVSSCEENAKPFVGSERYGGQVNEKCGGQGIERCGKHDEGVYETDAEIEIVNDVWGNEMQRLKGWEGKGELVYFWDYRWETASVVNTEGVEEHQEEEGEVVGLEVVGADEMGAVEVVLRGEGVDLEGVVDDLEVEVEGGLDYWGVY
jgi:hypothetical protein